jgi:anti-sigma B factor antagonist
LRVLLKVQKYMNKKGDFKLTHVSEVIEEIFEITGFSDILTIE